MVKQNNINKMVFTVFVVILLLVGLSVFSSVSFVGSSQIVSVDGGDIIVVDDEGDGDYTCIQDAVDNASIGTTIHVYSGTYAETTIRKSITLTGIPSELDNGSDVGKPVIVGDGRLIYLCDVNDCYIQGFELFNGDKGIMLINSSNNILSENNISNCIHGIHVMCGLGPNPGPTTKNIIEKNYVTHSGVGILLEYASNNTVRNNSVTYNVDHGIGIISSYGNHIYNNYFSHNGCTNPGLVSDAGVTLLGSCDTVIEKNCFEDNTHGVFIAGATDTIVRYNNFLGNIRKEAYGSYTSTTVWDSNYWKRPRLFPKPVLIIKKIIYIPLIPFEIPIHRIQFDWHPARERYDI